MKREKQAPDSCTAGDNPGIEAGICQVEYSNTPAGPVIHIFGRRVTGQAVHLEVTGFRPYFYAPADQVDGAGHSAQITPDCSTAYCSIRGEPLRRFYTERPTDVRDLRERYHPHYEADIPFATRFLIDMAITGGVAAPGSPVDYRDVRPADVNAPARICFLDIECEDERGFPEPERDKIVCITCWDSFDGTYTSLLLGCGGMQAAIPEALSRGGLKNGCFSPDRHRVMVFEDEATLLRGFADYIKKTDPDILSGWNFVDFDMPYITGRMEAIGLPPAPLSRLAGQTERNAVRGRALFDLLSAYKKMHTPRAGVLPARCNCRGRTGGRESPV